MGVSQQIYLGAYLHVKTDLDWYDALDGRDDLYEAELNRDGELFFCPNKPTGLELNVKIDNEDSVIDFSQLNSAAMIQNFMIGYENVIDLVRSKVPISENGKSNVNVRFGLLVWKE